LILQQLKPKRVADQSFTGSKIGEAFRTFGISDKTLNLLVVKVTTDPAIMTLESVKNHLEESIQGTPTSLTDETLSGVCDLAKIKKVYKFPNAAPKQEDKVATDPSDEVEKANEERVLERSILGAIALRGAT
jgi:EKC/KEOPS complex subunit CGI121/TPRKB